MVGDGVCCLEGKPRAVKPSTTNLVIRILTDSEGKGLAVDRGIVAMLLGEIYKMLIEFDDEIIGQIGTICYTSTGGRCMETIDPKRLIDKPNGASENGVAHGDFHVFSK